MNAIGTVIEIDKNNMAVVSTQRSSACSSCHNCEASGACHAELIFGEQKSVVIHKAENAVGAKVGDTVEISASTNKTLLISALVFVLPLLITIICYFCLSAFIVNVGLLTALLVVLYFLSFVVMAKMVNVYAKNNIKTFVVRILEESI